LPSACLRGEFDVNTDGARKPAHNLYWLGGRTTVMPKEFFR